MITGKCFAGKNKNKNNTNKQTKKRRVHLVHGYTAKDKHIHDVRTNITHPNAVWDIFIAANRILVNPYMCRKVIRYIPSTSGILMLEKLLYLNLLYLPLLALRRHNCMHFSHRPQCIVTVEFKLKYLKNLKLFSIKEKELFEPIVL